ncbi:MAG TPA: GspH/FimT family pseudopilin [Casimicrobiaceae bacterium]|nr:GspH/FimT family pseudopilin [Casimicrobiaceae bacterium]
MRAGTTASRERRLRTTQRGLTMVELAFVMLVVAVLAAVSVPSLTNLVVSQRLRAAGTDLVSSLQIARSEAIKRNGNVTVRPAADSWTSGWVVATALGDALDSKNALGNRVTVASAPDAVVYGPNGRLVVAGVTRFQFADTQSESGVPSRCVIVDTSGYPRVEARSCQ